MCWMKASCIMSFRLFHIIGASHMVLNSSCAMYIGRQQKWISIKSCIDLRVWLYENVAHSETEPELYTRPVDLRTQLYTRPVNLRTQFDAFGCFWCSWNPCICDSCRNLSVAFLLKFAELFVLVACLCCSNSCLHFNQLLFMTFWCLSVYFPCYSCNLRL